MYEEKKAYLKSYTEQQRKIERLKKTALLSPEREKECETEIKNSERLRKEIEAKIETVKDGTLRELLYEKYVFAKTLDEISLILNYSKRHIERLHIKALEEIII